MVQSEGSLVGVCREATRVCREACAAHRSADVRDPTAMLLAGEVLAPTSKKSRPPRLALPALVGLRSRRIFGWAPAPT